MPEKTKKLYKSKTDKIIFGVAGGLGEYFEFDPVLVRAVFILLALINGLGVLLYIILAVIMPRHGGEEPEINRRQKAKDFVRDLGREAENLAQKTKKNRKWLGSRRNIIGVIIILIGVIALLNQVVPWHWISWNWLFALAVIVVGLVIIFKKK
ncbi:MAG: hypothetical protein COU85_00095 [Candidatus Portnoybacteria bacterium CG10_big_fil_rev_8_21_14_0_10_44_7]|uniref:Phage shock protein PspC N-terminal domain-containing protein n=1 Tax=Candidatus Portnoybacteria bacterium CG10_big_fil_rev_8_21_14_0_10_44_7 TaxID=1974816 RepID=A0A2M8KJL8_9BACT|nr:MAG: hypothetical protein COU85_00095 [Candidatus Portnoybacteria bacterium CG10_big_fil_rev_8_21_14_0_10_44_7]